MLPGTTGNRSCCTNPVPTQGSLRGLRLILFSSGRPAIYSARDSENHPGIGIVRTTGYGNPFIGKHVENERVRYFMDKRASKPLNGPREGYIDMPCTAEKRDMPAHRTRPYLACKRRSRAVRQYVDCDGMRQVMVEKIRYSCIRIFREPGCHYTEVFHPGLISYGEVNG